MARYKNTPTNYKTTISKINTLVNFAKKTEQSFPTLTQKVQQPYSQLLYLTGRSKRYGEIRDYEEYLKEGSKLLKEKFIPISEEEYASNVVLLYEDLKGYRSKSQITKQQYIKDAATLETMLKTPAFEELADYDLSKISKSKRRELLKKAYKITQEHSGFGSISYGYFLLIEELFLEELGAYE